MSKTLLLDTDTWDIQLDSSGNLATVSGSYAVAQSVANAVRLFTKDAFFAQNQGIPHFLDELGNKPSPALVIDRMEKAAQSVANVAKATATLVKLEKRVLEGNIEITTKEGDFFNVEF